MSMWQAVRGTKDLIGEDCLCHRHVIDQARRIAETYGFQEIITPIFEYAPVFLRSLGDATDIVSKEMYLLEDKGGEQLALRPEGTAGVVRAFLSNSLEQNVPQKFFYAGPMFRYERPQKGRQRQFHQIGVEVIGAAEPLADVETIALGAQILEKLGVGASITLKINTLGDAESRQLYRAALVAYFEQYRSKLSVDSQQRLERNPLRILDSKDEGDRKILAGAPRREAFLTASAKAFFDQVLEGLDALKIVYEIDPFLVRGLDYYCHTAFEFVSTDLGAQSAVLAGGRYDGLTATLGGATQACIGWAAGIERLSLLLTTIQQPVRPIAMVPIGAEAEKAAFQIAQQLRHVGVAVIMEYNGNVGKRMKRAAKANARAAWLLGEDELRQNIVTWRDLDSGEQQQLPLQQAVEQVSQG